MSSNTTQTEEDSESTAVDEQPDSGENDRCIELSGEAAAATRTALNDVKWYDLASTLNVRSDETAIAVTDTLVALAALHKQRVSLERVEGEPTLYDPNGEDVYLAWTRTAIKELEEFTDVEGDR